MSVSPLSFDKVKACLFAHFWLKTSHKTLVKNKNMLSQHKHAFIYCILLSVVNYFVQIWKFVAVACREQQPLSISSTRLVHQSLSLFFNFTTRNDVTARSGKCIVPRQEVWSFFTNPLLHAVRSPTWTHTMPPDYDPYKSIPVYVCYFQFPALRTCA